MGLYYGFKERHSKILQMKNKYILLVLLCTCLSYMGQSQTAIDALRYSELLPSGTARMVGVGGAMSSLGGDMGSLSLNPAGVAVYRKSEFNLSPAIQFTSVGSSLNDGAEFDENKAKFGIENIGLVFYKGYNNKKLQSFNFGVTLNRVTNFNRTTTYEGTTPGSIINGFQESAQGLFNTDLEGFTSGVAADAGAIFILDGDQDNEWSSDFRDAFGTLFDFESESIERKETITTTGGVSDLALTMGFNISHKLYIGIAGSFPIILYEETKRYEEDDSNTGAVPFFRNLGYDQTVTTTGTGVSAKAGFIYRITNEIRLGGAVHSPTRYSLSDEFSTSMQYFFIDGEGTSSQALIDDEGLSPLGSFDYALMTPWRFSGGASVVLKKFGFVSLDVEYFDYSNQEYNFSTNGSTAELRQAEDLVNNEISSTFSSALNIKIGAEYLIKKFRLRAGYGRFASAFQDGTDARNVISFGAGIRGEKAYLDLAFRNTSSTETYSPYTSPNQFSQEVTSNIGTNNLIMTFGYRF